MAWEERRIKLHAKDSRKKGSVMQRVNYAVVKVSMEERIMKRH